MGVRSISPKMDAIMWLEFESTVQHLYQLSHWEYSIKSLGFRVKLSVQAPLGHMGLSCYIYIVIHRQTVSLYRKSSVWLQTKGAWSWGRNPPNFTLDLVSQYIYIYIYIFSGTYKILSSLMRTSPQNPLFRASDLCLTESYSNIYIRGGTIKLSS